MPTAASGSASDNAWRLAAPSFVLPGDVILNCRFLQGRVDEVALCLFETRACLAYDNADLPPWLAELQGRRGQMRFHVHLPLDLPWTGETQETGEVLEAGSARRACEICVALARKTAFLSPRAFVLHPPPEPSLLEAFLAGWRDAGLDSTLICLENTVHNDLAESLPLAYAGECGLCLDFGHALAFGQEWLLRSEEAARCARLAHLYAPAADTAQGKGQHKHLPLTALDAEERRELKRFLDLLRRTGKDRTLLLELFHWPDWEASARVLTTLL